MKNICTAAVLATLLLTGCALGTGAQSDEAALIECQAKADQQYKARYTDQWNKAVDQCLKERQAD